MSEGSSYFGLHTTHTKRRSDAVITNKGYEMVLTVWGEGEGKDTVWVNTFEQLRAVGGEICFNGDQTEIWLRLPPGHKFGIKTFDKAEGF